MVLSATGIKKLTIVLWLFIREMEAYPMPEIRQFRWLRESTLALTTASLRKQLEFRYTPTGIYLGNVYTALRRYYNDAGWIGVVAFPAILSLIMNAFYRKVRLYNDNTIKHVYNTIIYASLLYVVPFQAMEDSFYINKVTIGYVMELAILYVCVLFVFKKTRLK